jgi:hypothetical protein
VAGESDGPAAPQSELCLLGAGASGRPLGADSCHTGWEVSGARRAGAESECVEYRQPEGKKRGKRGAAIDPWGFDAGKRVKGKKRHVLVDTLGLLLHALVPPANVQERDGGILLLSSLADRFPLLRKLFAEGA